MLIVNFEKIPHIVMVFPLLILKKFILAAYIGTVYIFVTYLTFIKTLK